MVAFQLLGTREKEKALVSGLSSLTSLPSEMGTLWPKRGALDYDYAFNFEPIAYELMSSEPYASLSSTHHLEPTDSALTE